MKKPYYYVVETKRPHLPETEWNVFQNGRERTATVYTWSVKMGNMSVARQIASEQSSREDSVSEVVSRLVCPDLVRKK